MKTLITSFLLSLALCSCDISEEIAKSNEEAKKNQVNYTANSFKSPQVIGTLPDGRIVKRVTVYVGYPDGVHYIYFVDNNVSINFRHSDGEDGVHSTQVIIDGVSYAPTKADID